MFTKPLQYIFTKKAFKQAYDDINKNSSGLDEISFKAFHDNFNENITTLIDNIIQDKYIPEPIKKIEIDKTNSIDLNPYFKDFMKLVFYLKLEIVKSLTFL